MSPSAGRAPRSPRAGAVALAVALASAGCGKDDGARTPVAPEWASARIEGLPAASGVAAWRDVLVFASSSESRLFTVPRAELRDGATVRARPVALDVDGERETTLRDESGPRTFRLKHLWEGPQRLSGVAVSGDGILYAASEAYRIVWFGPLEAGPDGAPERCRFHRAVEAPGARRTRRGESDWQDYGDATATNGISGVAVDGPDLIVIERGRGLDTPFAHRIDRLAGTTVQAIELRYAGPDDRPGSRGWADLAATPSGFLGLVVRVEEGVALGRVLDVPVPRLEPRRTGRFATGVLALPDVRPTEPFEGMTEAGETVWVVRSAGPDASILVWRSLR